MKRILLPLLTVSSLLPALAPRATAAAITSAVGDLHPRLLGPAAFRQRLNGGTATPAITAPQRTGASNDLVQSVLGGALQLSDGSISAYPNISGTGTVNVTGTGTLTIHGSTMISSGTVTTGGRLQVGGGNSLGVVNVVSGGTVTFNDWMSNSTDLAGVRVFPAGFTLVGNPGATDLTGADKLTLSLDTNGFNVRIHPDFRVVGDLNAGLSGQWVRIFPDGTNTWLGGLDFGNLNVLTRDGSGTLVLDSTGTTTLVGEPAPAPVPEPGTALLLALGALAAHGTRRRAV